MLVTRKTDDLGCDELVRLVVLRDEDPDGGGGSILGWVAPRGSETRTRRRGPVVGAGECLDQGVEEFRLAGGLAETAGQSHFLTRLRIDDLVE